MITKFTFFTFLIMLALSGCNSQENNAPYEIKSSEVKVFKDKENGVICYSLVREFSCVKVETIK